MQAMPTLLTKDLEPRHERLLAIVLIVLAIAAIAGTLWRYLPGWIGPGPLDAMESRSAAGDPTAAEPRARLAEHGLFGPAPTGNTESDLALPIDAPQTNLDLTLRGTLASKDPKNALAIIADSEDVERTYAVGAELPGEAVLHAVYRDRAILNRAGELETLPLRDPDRQLASGESARGESGSNGDRSGNDRQRPTTDQLRDDADEADELARAAEQLRNDPAALARQFTAVPVQEGGNLIGVRLRASGDSSLLSRIGLRGSDVVTAVNGVPLNDYSRANEVMSQLQSGTDFQVTILRNGREQQVNVSLGD